jgi:nucleotide-binding universal stress UspA family protein
MPTYRIVPSSEESGENVNIMRMKLRDSELRAIVKILEPADDWTHEVRMGRPARELTLSAEHRGADLLVVGRHQHGAVDRVLGGETVLQIMRMSAIPVLAVDSDLETPRTVVCAMDFSPSSILAAKTALQLMNGSGTLYIVFVESNRFPGDPVTRFRRVIEGDLADRSGIHVEPVVLNGRPASAVIQFAERVGADLVCAGSHGHGRVERFLLGSVSTGIVLNVDRAVMVVPPRS